MADWYVSSVTYAAIPAWAASTAYTVGQFVRPVTIPSNYALRHAYRCTVAGTSGGTEPTWSSAGSNNSTIASGGATFTNVSGQSAYGWSAAAGALYSLGTATVTTRPVIGDRIFVSSDHSELQSSGWILSMVNSSTYGLLQAFSVNRAGSVPPVPADLLPGAVVGTAPGSFANFTLEGTVLCHWEGFTFQGHNNLQFGSTGKKTQSFKDCTLELTGGGAQTITFMLATKIVLNNTRLKLSANSQGINISGGTGEIVWINTPSAIQGTAPTSLTQIGTGVAYAFLLTARGVDLSAVTGTLVTYPSNAQVKVLLDSCRIASGVTRLSASGATDTACAEVELVNCYDGTGVVHERYTAGGTLTTDRSTTLSGGAQDDLGAYSLKLVSSTRADFIAIPLESFWLDVGNSATGASKTATVEIISSGSLNNNDITLVLEYLGTSGSPVAIFGNSLATALTATAALTTSSATWNSPPATPVKQRLSVNFTPQRAGRVRGLVRLGKVSATVWVNPQVTIT